MKRLPLVVLFLALLSVNVTAQEGSATIKPVWYMTFVKTKPGKSLDYVRYVKEHLKPIYDEEKRQGLILDYKVFSKPMSDAPNDWNVAIAVSYKNYDDALGNNSELSRRFQEIRNRHFGSPDNAKRAEEQLDQMIDVPSTIVMREEIL